ncbi:MAG: hypothetical protein IMHGJWDQ_001703 [Candidatus Fervidibacter sp.]
MREGGDGDAPRNPIGCSHRHYRRRFVGHRRALFKPREVELKPGEIPPPLKELVAPSPRR